MAKKSSVTIRDIAAEAGVSRTAVWATLSKRPTNVAVGLKTREVILEAVDRLHYKPDILAKSFTNKKSYLLGFFAIKANEAFGLDVTSSIQHRAHREEYAVVTFVSDDLTEESSNLQTSLDRRVEGLIVNSVFDGQRSNANEFEKCLREGIPVVEIFGDFIPGAVKVNTDHRAIGRLGTEHLLDLGHRRILHYTFEDYLDTAHPGSHRDALRIWEGYRDTMSAEGLEPMVLTHPLAMNGPLSRCFFEAAGAMARHVAEHPAKPTAVVCYNDYEALALCRAFSEMGINVPGDVSVVGALDVPMASITSPGLTTVSYRPDLVGAQAAELCLGMVNGQEAHSTLVPPELKIRQSTAGPKT